MFRIFKKNTSLLAKQPSTSKLVSFCREALEKKLDENAEDIYTHEILKHAEAIQKSLGKLENEVFAILNKCIKDEGSGKKYMLQLEKIKNDLENISKPAVTPSKTLKR